MLRAKNSPMQPLKITGKALKQKQKLYEEKVDTWVCKIDSYTYCEERCVEKKLFTDFRILSYNGDQMGKVLEKDGRIFRGIYKESADAFLKLWKIGLVQTLSDLGVLPQTNITDYQTDEFPIILEHQVVDFSYAKMWTPRMIKEACITICLLDMVCRRFGYKLIDGHLNNITFVCNRPVFTDIGSIVEDKGQYTAYESSLIFAGGYKLIAASLGNSIVDRIQFFDENNNAIWHTPFCYDDLTIECRNLLKRFRRWHRFHSSFTAQSIVFKLFELGEVRPEYFDLIFSYAVIPELQISENKFLFEVIKNFDLSEVTVVNSGIGLAQQISSQLKCKTVFLHHDKDVVDFCRFNSENISCYCHNFIYGCDEQTLKSIRNEMVVAEYVMEKLMSYQNWKVESVFNALSKISDRYVAVSFRPGKTADRCVDNTVNNVSDLEKIFSSFFDIIDVVNKAGIWIFLGEKRGTGEC